jgi:hypothetical protein
MIPILHEFTHRVEPFRTTVFRLRFESRTPLHETGVTTVELEMIIRNTSMNEMEQEKAVCEVIFSRESLFLCFVSLTRDAL